MRNSKKCRECLDRLALPFAIIGLAAVSLFNWRLLHQDKVRLGDRKEPQPLPPIEQWPALPMVSVLVAAWKEADIIEHHIRSFLDLRYPRKELVLCAGGEDGTYELACPSTGHHVVVLEQHQGEGKQHALVRSLPLAKGDIIFFTDADCLLNDDAFEQTIYPLATGKERVTTGTSRPERTILKDSFIYHQWTPQRYAELFNEQSYSKGLLGRNCALIRQAVEQAWAPGASVPSGTDYYLALRVISAGHRIRYIPESKIETTYPSSLSAYIQQRLRWLRNLLLLGYRFNDWYHVRFAVLTSVIGIALLLLPLLPLMVGFFGLALWIIGWSAVAARRIRYAVLVKELEDNVGSVISLDMCRVILGDFIAWSRLLIDIWRPRSRERW